ncbi:hypothetical protein LIER_34576 [Lithospermum erythrorhizon]|uniref:Uncharacterized protein n=1 Tax=Lithospermum erythrorhizon TaxID=34254 RepID=A0AAV3RZX4_LITER
MLSWFNTLLEEEIHHLKTEKTSAFTKELVTACRMKTCTLNEVLTNATTGNYWIRGLLRLIDDRQQLYYVACSSYFTKIKYDIGYRYTCFFCKKEVLASLRPLVIMSIADHTNIILVIAIQEDGFCK